MPSERLRVSKFLTVLYPFLSAILMILAAVTPPATAAASSSCYQTHTKTIFNEAYTEALFRTDQSTSRTRSPNFNRTIYPTDYYEKYQARMSPQYKTYAFNRLYVPQFINVPVSSPRRLNGSFILLDVLKPVSRSLDQNLRDLDETYFYPAEMVWRGPKEDPIFPSTLGQGAMARLFSFMHSNATSIRQLIEESLKRIYQSFAKQGPERQILVPIVKEQNARDQDRTTHFEYGIIKIQDSVRKESLQVDEVAHMQVMTSTGPDQPFHFEEQWGKIDRIPGEIPGEMGRLILKPWKELDPESQSRVPPNELKSIKYRLVHKAFAWANNDARLDRVYFQVNDRVRALLTEMGWALEEAQATKKTQIIDGKMTEEWLFNMDKHLMIETEKRMLKNLMKVYFRKLANHPSGQWLAMSFDQNEIKTLMKLGIVRVSNIDPTPLLVDQIRPPEWPIFHNPDPSADPVFRITPEQLKNSEYFSFYFSSEMIQKLEADWARTSF